MVTLLYCRVQFTSLIFFNVLLLVLSNEERRHLNIRRDEGNGVVLKTSYGRLAGFQAFIPSYFDVDEECKSHDNDASSRLPINVFLGIPFARPPIAELRFEKPVPPKSWPETVVKNATAYGPMCAPLLPEFVKRMQFMAMKTNDKKDSVEPVVSEDCLYLNVVAPGWLVEAELNRGFPVAVIIHGGGFGIGSAREFDWRFLADKYVRHGIVVVTIQYRLGQFGFAATGDESFTGNYGLWDQKAALEYVQKNIGAFGGDPRSVTIWGHSAGGASVSFLSYSPQTQNLFTNMIAMSGTGFAEWSLSNRVITETEKMARTVGCESYLHSSHSLKQCLRGKASHELQTAVEQIGPRTWDTNLVRFSPRLDEHFFSDDLPILLKQTKAAKKATMIGATDMEFLSFALFENIPKEWGAFFVPQNGYQQFGRTNFVKLAEKGLATEQTYGAENARRLQKMVLDFYIGTDGDGSTTPKFFYLSKYVELLSDIGFLLPVLIEANAKADAGWPVYLYMMDYVNGLPKYVPINGSYHSVEYPHIFDIHYRPEAGVFTAEDKAFQKAFTSAIVQFIKSSNPSTPTVNWQALNNSGNEKLVPYLKLNSHPRQSKDDALSRKFKFWQQIRQQFDFDPIRGFHKISLHSRDEL